MVLLPPCLGPGFRLAARWNRNEKKRGGMGEICPNTCGGRELTKDRLAEVLEHVIRPHEAAAALFRVAAPCGTVFVTTPFICEHFLALVPHLSSRMR